MRLNQKLSVDNALGTPLTGVGLASVGILALANRYTATHNKLMLNAVKDAQASKIQPNVP
jgi:hypothetical protein